MKKVITSNRLAVYWKYAGDEDAWSRLNLPDEQVLFGEAPMEQSDTWMVISSAIQDVALISRGLVSLDYQQQVIKRLRTLCDNESFVMLTQDIS